MNHIIVDILKYEVLGKEILSDISCTINASDRIAIVGGNGVGKTTFMKILTGEITEFDGKINNIGTISMGYLSQIHFDQETRTVREELRLAFKEIRAAESTLNSAEHYMMDHPEDMGQSNYIQSSLIDFICLVDTRPRISSSAWRGGLGYLSSYIVI